MSHLATRTHKEGHDCCFYEIRIKKGEDQGKYVTFVTRMTKETDKA